MNSEFANILTAAVTPIVLISGTGLILLSIVNRYGTAIARIRSLIAERRASDGARAECLSEQIAILLKRCNCLKLSLGSIVVSVIFSCLIILGSILTVTRGFDIIPLLTAFLVLDCMSIVIANVLLLLDVTFSLRALRIEIDYP